MEQGWQGYRDMFLRCCAVVCRKYLIVTKAAEQLLTTSIQPTEGDNFVDTFICNCKHEQFSAALLVSSAYAGVDD